MKSYLISEIAKLLSHRLSLVVVFGLVIILAFYQYYFFLLVSEEFSILQRQNSKISFGDYFYSTLANRVHFIYIISCAVISTFIWELENKFTIRQAIKISRGKVWSFILAKVLVSEGVILFIFLAIFIVIKTNIYSLTPRLHGAYYFHTESLLLFLFIQYLGTVPIVLLNFYWYVLLGEQLIVVFIFSLISVYLLGFISFTPFYLFLQHTYLNTTVLSFRYCLFLLLWVPILFLFLRKQFYLNS